MVKTSMTLGNNTTMNSKEVEHLAGDLVVKVYSDLFTAGMTSDECNEYLSLIIKTLSAELAVRLSQPSSNEE